MNRFYAFEIGDFLPPFRAVPRGEAARTHLLYFEIAFNVPRPFRTRHLRRKKRLSHIFSAFKRTEVKNGIQSLSPLRRDGQFFADLLSVLHGIHVPKGLDPHVPKELRHEAPPGEANEGEEEMKKTMTLKEIAELCNVSGRTLRRWIESDKMSRVSDKSSDVRLKLEKAFKTKKPAQFTLEETVAVIKAGGNELLANLLMENALSNGDLPALNEPTAFDTELIARAVTIGVETALKKLLPRIGPLSVLKIPESARDEYVIPTQLGKMFHPPVSAQQVNGLLAEKGFQYKAGKEWIASEKGRKYSQAFPVSLNSGRIKYQLYWKRGVLEQLTGTEIPEN